MKEHTKIAIIAVSVAMFVLLCGFFVAIVLADDSTETGDTRKRPVSCYGKQTDGTPTAILVDADGVVQTT